ncbi:MAG: hypothetical protein GY912_04980 [Candidatus Marinimicrobia bacterium]|nr:hypothetical protein [Candidatus Neomarinimicrobiota bacterium]
MFATSNPISGLRSSNESIDDSIQLFNLLAIQSPIICYQGKQRFYAIGGFFTLQKLKHAIAQEVISPDEITKIFVLSNKPSKEIIKSIIQFGLVNDLFLKCFISDTKRVSHLLRSYFKKDDGRRSLFGSSEWLQILPGIKTSKLFAQFLSISEKEL